MNQASPPEDVAPNETSLLGQFIPTHYHQNMLMDQHRIRAYKEASGAVVKPGARVLDLGGGTGVLSFFATQAASKVHCVEFNADMVGDARRW